MAITGRFTRGLVIGGIIGATVSMLNSSQNYRLRRKLMRAGRNMWNRKNGLMDAIADLF